MRSSEKHLFLFRGLPGSGKSTLAFSLATPPIDAVYSVDDFFTNELTGKYHFEYDKNHLAYKHCLQQTEQSMQQCVRKIFVHNTFTMAWEIEPYVELANTYGYVLHVATVEKYHNNGNIHLVSDEQLKRMAEKYKVKLI